MLCAYYIPLVFSTYLSSGDTAPIRPLQASTDDYSAFWYISSVTLLLLPEVSSLLIHRKVRVYTWYDTTCGHVNNNLVVKMLRVYAAVGVLVFDAELTVVFFHEHWIGLVDGDTLDVWFGAFGYVVFDDGFVSFLLILPFTILRGVHVEHTGCISFLPHMVDLEVTVRAHRERASAKERFTLRFGVLSVLFDQLGTD